MPELSKVLKIRLKHEYEEMQKVPKTSLYDWTIAPGEEAPYVSSYLITYHIKTLVLKGAKVGWQHDTTVRISKKAITDYWSVVVAEGLVPYHPNWFSRGNVCLGDKPGQGMKDPSKWLYEVINYIGKMLQFQPDIINSERPANGEANTYWLKHKDDKDSQGHKFFPTSDAVFPVPRTKKVIIIKSTTRNN